MSIQAGIRAMGKLPVHNHTLLEQGGIINNDSLFQSCGCRAILTAPQAIPSGAPVKILFNAKTYDIGGDFDADGVDSEFLTPSDGYYRIGSRGRLEQVNDNTEVLIYIYLDGGVECQVFFS